MKAATLVGILHDQAENWQARGDALPVGEDRIPYAVATAFRELADAIDSRVEVDL